MNYFYKKNGSFILCVSTYTTPEEIAEYVPKGYQFWLYNPGEDIEMIYNTKECDGIGTGLDIEV